MPEWEVHRSRVIFWNCLSYVFLVVLPIWTPYLKVLSFVSEPVHNFAHRINAHVILTVFSLSRHMFEIGLQGKLISGSL